MARRAIFLDRDGVVNIHRDDYVKSIDELIILPDVSEAIKLINEKGFLVIIVTNQSAVGRGIISQDTLRSIHLTLEDKLGTQNARIDAIYFCPHIPDANCPCRKPKPGLLFRAASDYNIDLSKSWFIGDSETDIMTAKNAGCKSIRMKRNGSLAQIIKDILSKDAHIEQETD